MIWGTNRSRTGRLSGETAAKQTVKHPDLAPADYARVQRIFDEGEVFAASERIAIGFVEETGRLWRAVVRSTRDGGETFLATFHRVDEGRLQRARKGLEPLR